MSVWQVPGAAKKTVEQRLAEIDDLRDRGVITEEEHAQARVKVISGS
jgi:hypothetical protein